MTLAGWIVISGVTWGYGYLRSKWLFTRDLVRVPAWLYVLAGMPRNSTLPTNVVSARGIGMQIAGIVTLTFRFVPSPGLPWILQFGIVSAWFLGIAVGGVSAFLLLKTRRYGLQQ
jgi:hypothetical protein